MSDIEIDRVKLFALLKEAFTVEQLKVLCKKLDIDASKIGLESNPPATIALIAMVSQIERQNRFEEFVEACEEFYFGLISKITLQPISSDWHPETLNQQAIIIVESILQSKGKLYGDTGCMYWDISPPSPEEWLSDVFKVDELRQQIDFALEGIPALIYKQDVNREIVPATRLVLAPTINQFDILRIEQTRGSSIDLETSDVIKNLMILNNQFGIEITGSNQNVVEFIFKDIPTSNSIIRDLAEFLVQLAPDIVEEDQALPENYFDTPVLLWWE
ncbi:MAG: DUF4253 domain-containing protein [Anaerolineales bacterium]|nr:DUF4253 domain-containing protein [Anaerolineales bacterium]